MRPHSNLFSHHPLVYLAVSLSTGICTALYCQFRFVVAAGILCTALALLLFIKQRLRFTALALLSAMFCTGAVLADLERHTDESRELRKLVEQSNGEALTLTGWLDSPPEFAQDRVYLSLRVENVPGRV